MRVETAMASAFKKAGGDTDAALLYNVAVDMLRKHGGDVRKAVGMFSDEVRDAGGIMSALISYEATRNAAFAYLEKVSADMVGQKSSGGVHENDGADCAHILSGPSGSVPPQGGGSVRPARDSLVIRGAPKTSEGDGVRNGNDGRRAIGPSPSPDNGDDAVQKAADSPRATGRVVPITNKPRGIEALRAVQRHAGPSLFDTLLIRNRPIGDIVFGELNGIIATNKREAALLVLIRDHAQVFPATTKVRDVIHIGDLQRMAQKAAEMSDA